MSPVAHHPRAGAIAAIAGAEVQAPAAAPGPDSGGPVRGRGCRVLAQRVAGFAPGLRELAGRGNDRSAASGCWGSSRRNQAHVVGRDGDGQDLPGPVEPFPLVGGQVEHFFELLAGPDAVSGLPTPVVPLLVGHVAVKGLAKGPGARRPAGRTDDGNRGRQAGISRRGGSGRVSGQRRC